MSDMEMEYPRPGRRYDFDELSPVRANTGDDGRIDARSTFDPGHQAELAAAMPPEQRPWYAKQAGELGLAGTVGMDGSGHELALDDPDRIETTDES